MMARLTQQLAAMRTYESEALQSKARRTIPVRELSERANQRADAAETAFADRLLLELLHWFKHSFFSWVSAAGIGGGWGEGGKEGKDWNQSVRKRTCAFLAHTCFALLFSRLSHAGLQVDAVPCAACGGKTTVVGMLPPSDEDRRYGAGKSGTKEKAWRKQRWPRGLRCSRATGHSRPFLLLLLLAS